MFRFGRHIEGDRLAYWGARAIYQNMNIDLVHDRQTWDADETRKDEAEAFHNWIADHGIPKLRKAVKELAIYGDSTDVVKIEDGRYYLEASPQRSFGYLYIGAVMKGESHAFSNQRIE